MVYVVVDLYVYADVDVDVIGEYVSSLKIGAEVISLDLFTIFIVNGSISA